MGSIFGKAGSHFNIKGKYGFGRSAPESGVTQDLQFTRDAEHGYLLNGTIVASIAPFSFRVNFDGTPTAKISIYQFGLKVGEVEVEIPNLYGWDIKNGLINPSAAEFFETLLDPLNLLSGIEPFAN